MTFLFLSEKHEGGDADRDESDDEVFVWSEFAAIEKDVHEHDWDEFT